METRHCGQDKGIFFCPVHNASTTCSLQAFGIRCIYLFISLRVPEPARFYESAMVLVQRPTTGRMLEETAIQTIYM